MVRCSGGPSRDEFECSPLDLALRGKQSNALEFEPVFEQTLQLDSIGFVVDTGKRLQGHFVFAQIQVLSAERLGQNKREVALVEQENLPIWDCTEVRRDRSERDALDAPGRAKDSCVAGVADIKVEPEGRAARCRTIAERRRVLRIVGAGIRGEPRPDACQGRIGRWCTL
jgi:hypothetical protein